MEDKKAKFLKAYAQVPTSLREQIIVIVDEQHYNWNSVLFEIKNNTQLSKKILNTLSNMNII
jgi:hypothetical protein